MGQNVSVRTSGDFKAALSCFLLLEMEVLMGFGILKGIQAHSMAGDPHLRSGVRFLGLLQWSVSDRLYIFIC